MQLFDRVDRETVEKREYQLTIFSLSVIAVLVAGVAVLMYPTVATHPIIFTEETSRIFFLSFCGLSVLLMGYLIDRQIVVRRLRREIREAQVRYRELRYRTGEDLLGALAGMNHFQDRLVMEFKRAVSMRDTLSVMVILLTPSKDHSDGTEHMPALGDAIKSISRRLRREDSLYYFAANTFGIMLPGLSMQDAGSFASRLGEGLSDVAGATVRFTQEIRIFNYPQHAATAHELEKAVRALLPDDLVTEPSLAEAYESSESGGSGHKVTI